MTKIKICGLTRPEDILAVNECLPDYIGFIFADSRRRIDDTTAIELKQRLDSRIEAVGVFVNEKPERIIRLCETGTIDLVQLHGDETEEYIRELKRSISNRVIKAIRMKSREELKTGARCSSDYLLLDAYQKEQYGGAGTAFDWSMITPPDKPFFLAGGIDSSNVLQAINLVKPYGIDVSSGVETDGRKDAAKIKELITKVRSVEK